MSLQDFAMKDIKESELEVCRVVSVVQTQVKIQFWDKIFENISCWKRMRRRVGILLAFLDWLGLGRCRPGTIDEGVLRRASHYIWKGVSGCLFR